MTEPTDAELLAEWDRVSHIADAGQRRLACLRAVLAKWGTPPAVAGEPVAWMGTYDKTDLYYLKPPQADVVPLYATPQPTQPQAGAVPLTDEQIEAATGAKIGTPLFLAAKGFVLATEAAHGIKGGQHGTS